MILASFILLLNFGVNVSVFAAEEGLAQASSGKEAYTGKEPLKSASEMPAELAGVKIEEKLGGQLDLTQTVTTEKGEKVQLSTFFKSHKPVVISPVYFNCPGLCNFHLNGFTDTLKMVDWSPGNQFEMIALSFDSRETPDVAAKKKDNYLKLYGRPETANGWHFLTADEPTVQAITQQLGFNFRWNEKAKEWAHASAAIVISPEGKISRYLHGIQFEPRDVKLALNEASNGKVGNIVDSVMLYCFKYDRHESKYGLQVYRVMQLGGALMVAILAIWLIPVMIRAKRENG